MANFKLGDVVQLKSGEPLMTITLVAEESSTTQVEKFACQAYRNTFGLSAAYYGCICFVSNKKEEGVFPEETLTIAKNDKSKKYSLNIRR